jgi:transcriptional regulator with XRE-family HTH domain
MSDLKLKRLAAGISGSVLCAKTGISRSRLSLIESGYTTLSTDEATRLSTALDQLIQAKAIIDRVADSVGWPTGARHDK